MLWHQPQPTPCEAFFTHLSLIFNFPLVCFDGVLCKQSAFPAMTFWGLPSLLRVLMIVIGITVKSVVLSLAVLVRTEYNKDVKSICTVELLFLKVLKFTKHSCVGLLWYQDRPLQVNKGNSLAPGWCNRCLSVSERWIKLNKKHNGGLWGKKNCFRT